MSRPLRLTYPGALYHVTARGNRRDDIYRSDCDREKFNEIIAAVVARCGWRMHAWCQMSNHYHLLVETPHANLPSGMHQLNGGYASYFNRVHQRIGHVFQGRYTAINVQKESYFLELARYVVLNPVRAGMVQAAGDWAWSSYRDMTGMRVAPDWLSTAPLLHLFGRRHNGSTDAYAHFVAAGVDSKSPWSGLRNGIYLGDDDFVDSLQGNITQTPTVNEIPVEQRQSTRRSLEELALESPHRNVAIVAAYASGHYTLDDIGSHFGLHYSRVSRIIKAAKDEKAKGKT